MSENANVNWRILSISTAKVKIVFKLSCRQNNLEFPAKKRKFDIYSSIPSQYFIYFSTTFVSYRYINSPTTFPDTFHPLFSHPDIRIVKVEPDWPQCRNRSLTAIKISNCDASLSGRPFLKQPQPRKCNAECPSALNNVMRFRETGCCFNKTTNTNGKNIKNRKKYARTL